MITKTATGLRTLLQTTTRTLAGSGIPDARWEAEVLAAQVLDCTRADLYTSDSLFPDLAQQDRLSGLVQRRCLREPLQYLLGTEEFWGLEFCVTPDVLIPRPETELIIETVLESFRKNGGPKIFVDLGTGSGCIAVTLGRLFSEARILGLDRSGPALEIARFNASKHGVSGQIDFLQGDLFEALKDRDLTGQIDLIAANPPYVRARDMDSLQPEVRLHEPRLALDGGPDGLDFYRRILPPAFTLLRPGGHLCLEVGMNQMDPVRGMAADSGWQFLKVAKDLRGIERVGLFSKPDKSLKKITADPLQTPNIFHG